MTIANVSPSDARAAGFICESESTASLALTIR